MDSGFTGRLRKGAEEIRASSAMQYAGAAGAPLALEIAADEIESLERLVSHLVRVLQSARRGIVHVIGEGPAPILEVIDAVLSEAEGVRHGNDAAI